MRAGDQHGVCLLWCMRSASGDPGIPLPAALHAQRAGALWARLTWQLSFGVQVSASQCRLTQRHS